MHKTFMGDQKKAFVRGQIHPKPEELRYGEKRHFHFYKDEMPRFFVEFLGAPVCLEHNADNKIGKVTQIEYSRSGSVMAELEIDLAMPLGLETMQNIRSGTLRGLSVCYTTMQDQDGARTGGFKALEISVCKEGALPHTRIESYGYDGRVFVSASGMKEIYGTERVIITKSVRESRTRETMLSNAKRLRALME